MRDGVGDVELRLLASDIFLERVGLKERSGGRCPQGNESRRSVMLPESHSCEMQVDTGGSRLQNSRNPKIVVSQCLASTAT